jgi:hypothetical protein
MMMLGQLEGYDEGGRTMRVGLLTVRPTVVESLDSMLFVEESGCLCWEGGQERGDEKHVSGLVWEGGRGVS